MMNQQASKAVPYYAYETSMKRLATHTQIREDPIASSSCRPTKRRRVEPHAESSSSNCCCFISDKSSRSVRFSETNETNILSAPTSASQQQEDKINAWYSQQDIRRFKVQESSDAAVLRYLISAVPGSTDHMPQDSSIYRGLERLLSIDVATEMQGRRRSVVKSVLAEQLRQEADNSYDVTRIANASLIHSGKATVWARTLGNL